MKKNHLSGILVAGLFSLGVNAQQWTGSTSSSGNISRTGNVGIGVAVPSKPLDLLGDFKITGNIIRGQQLGALGIFSGTQFNDGSGIILNGNSSTIDGTQPDNRFGDIEFWAGKGNDVKK
jgi:hypothetical protein